MSEIEELAKLVRKSIAFADWAAGEGICPSSIDDPDAPEDFLFDYSAATEDEEWETLADRISSRIEADAAEITRLRAEVEALKGAAKPFVDATEDIDADTPDSAGMWEHPASMNVTAGDFRRLATHAQEKTDERHG